MSEGKERRKWPRLDVGFRIKLRAVEGEGQGLSGESFCTSNISTGGLMFESEEAVAVSEGKVFDVEISMPLAKYGFASSRRLEARGKVCRVEAHEGESRAVALEFMAPPRFLSS